MIGKYKYMLTGKTCINTLNLTGKSMYSNSPPAYVSRIKELIFDRYITPILVKNWKILNENIHFINIYLKKVNAYYESSHDETLLVYKYMLEVIKTAYDTNSELFTLEEKLFGHNEDIAQIIFKVPHINLKPELELYNLIIGKPNKNLYNKEMVSYISSLLKIDFITFDEIKNKLLIYNI